jgi:hypothetical protein
MSRYIILFSLILIASYMSGQKVSGIITDEQKNPVEYATVILLMASDSTMAAFANSSRKGEYVLKAPKSGKYIVQISYLGYETIEMPLEIKDADIIMDEIQLKPGSKMLDVIEIKDFANPITFGKDTIQYNASAFKIQPGDMVEDLLKKLPGVEVQRDGSVKALGENVKNVLVDGKEFFGKDTKIATKNLDADAVDKVQVFDRKSDHTEFTGIDDGSRERSINLKLKEDKKVGYFGTAEASAGTKERFKARANINRFKPGVRTSFIGMANNINEQNFSFNEYIDFMGGIGAMLGGGGGGRFTLNMDDMGGLPINPGGNQGIQKSIAGGLNFNKDFSSSTTLEFSGFGNHFNNNLIRNSIRENLLPERKFFTTSDENQQSDNTSGSFTLRFKTKVDSTQNLVIRANGSLGNNGLISNEWNSLQNALRIKQNDNTNDFLRNGNNHNLSGNILWQIKSAKPGRVWSLNASGGNAHNSSNADLNTLYNFYFPQTIVNKLIQNQTGLNDGLNYKAEASWTEPLKRKRYIEFKTSIANNTNKTSSDYFDIINDNPVRNLLLSNNFQRDYVQRNAGTNFIFSGEKYNLTVGARYKNSTLTGIINENPQKIKNNFNAILPNAFYTFRFGLSENLNFNYFSELNEPTLQQLQPVVNNTNPLSVYIGNPSLRPEQMHNMNLSYMRYDAFNFTMLYANLQTNYTHNKISEALTIDSSLVRYYTPENIKNEITTSSRLEYETPIRPLKLKTRLVLKGNYNQGYSIINEVANPVKRYGYGYNFSIENRNKNVLDILGGYKINNSDSRFASDKNLNQSYSEKTWYAELGLNIKDWVNIKSRFDHLTIKPSFSESSTSYPLWTASITSYITKDKRLRATLSCFDILNQNQGIRTSSNLNYTDITVSNVLSRYFMLGIAYNIKGFQKKSGVEIQMSGER